MKIVKFKVSSAFAAKYEGVKAGDVLDGVQDGQQLEVVVPLVADICGFKNPRAVPAAAGEDGELILPEVGNN